MRRKFFLWEIFYKMNNYFNEFDLFYEKLFVFCEIMRELFDFLRNYERIIWFFAKLWENYLIFAKLWERVICFFKHFLHFISFLVFHLVFCKSSSRIITKHLKNIIIYQKYIKKSLIFSIVPRRVKKIFKKYLFITLTYSKNVSKKLKMYHQEENMSQN